MIGRTISHYRIESKLGEGGMGVVYKALDVHLDRPVALKVLPPEAVADPERKKRFVQEAKAASALNHPNIVTIYEIGTTDGVDFIAMEFVPGKTLEDWIGRKLLGPAQVLKCSVQMADALAKAHTIGIVHRDLKPANIMVTNEGSVKLLDFGLAKLTEHGGNSELTASMRSPRTEEGTIIGTVAYMSPEQAEAKNVDTRSDVFSFGSVLYEMATGRRAFQGETRISTLSAILHQEPPPATTVAEGVPRELEKIITRCLRKDPDRRIQHMVDVKLALQELKEESESGKLSGEEPVRKKLTYQSLLIASVAGLVLLGAAGAAWWLSRPSLPAPAPLLTRLTSDSGLTTDPALSADGKLLAFASDRGGQGNLSIWLQQVGGGEAIRLTRHEADDHEPAFSPDGRTIAFRSEREGGGVYTISALGGEPRKVASQGRGPQFSPDGNWIAYWVGAAGGGAAHHKIFVVASTGGLPPRPIQPGFGAAYPTWSPDGKHLIFIGWSPDPKLSSGDRLDWWSTPVDEGVAVKLGALAAFRSAKLGRPFPEAWLPGGTSILFSATPGDARNLWKLPISPETWQVTGRPEQVTFGTTLEVKPSVALGPQGGPSLAFASLIENIDIWELPVDANRAKVVGELRRLTEGAASDSYPSISADGKKMVFISTRSGNPDTWVKDLGTGKETPITITPLTEISPAISANGSRLAYGIREGQKVAIYGTPPTPGLHTGGFARLCEDCGQHVSWSPDGTKILYNRGEPSGVYSLDIFSGRSRLLVADPQYDLYEPYFSPDDRWITFNAATASRSRIFVALFSEGRPVPASEWIAIANGDPWDDNPRWSPDGNTLYFTTEGDGFRCISAQRLEPATKRPKGPPIAIYHSHHARRSLLNVELGPLKISVARDKIVFNMSERTGNIWMTKLQGQ